jgi:choline monooxygenase
MHIVRFLLHTPMLGPGRTRETTHLFPHPESMHHDRAQGVVDGLAAFWDQVNREDSQIVERVQEGLSTTPLSDGRLCSRLEEPLHRFQNMVIDRMVGLWQVPAGDSVESAPMFAS